MEMPAVGQAAPPFEAPTQGRATVDLSQYRGQKVALYFYPRDNTPGCTRQAGNLRDNCAELAAHDIAVVGVSTDCVVSHEKFAARHALPFPLVADPEKVIVQAYGVIGEKKMFGRTFLGVTRTTFLIDEDGIIVRIIRRPKTGDHAAEILRGFGITG